MIPNRRASKAGVARGPTGQWPLVLAAYAVTVGALASGSSLADPELDQAREAEAATQGLEAERTVRRDQRTLLGRRIEELAEALQAPELPGEAVVAALLKLPRLDLPTLRAASVRLRAFLPETAGDAGVSIDGGAVDLTLVEEYLAQLEAAKAAPDGGVILVDAGADLDSGTVEEDPRPPLERASIAELVALQRTLQSRLIDRLLVDLDAKAAADAARALEEERRARADAEATAKKAAEARARAIEEAGQAMNERLERILQALAKVEGARETIATSLASLHERTGAALGNVPALEEAVQAAAVDLAAAPKGTAIADRAVERARELQAEALDTVERALNSRTAEPSERLREALALARRPELLGVDPTAQLTDADPNITDAHGRLGVAFRELVLRADEHQLSRDARWFVVADRFNKLVREAQILRQDGLAMRSSGGRELLGISAASIPHVRLSIRTLLIEARLHVTRRVHDVRQIPTVLSDPLQVGLIAWALFKVALLIALLVFLRRRGAGWFDKIKSWALGRAKAPASARLTQSIFALIEDTGGQVVIGGFALFAYDVMAPIGPSFELRAALEITLWVIAYQVSAQLTNRLVLRLAKGRLSITVPTKLRILRTVRAVHRYLFAAGYVVTTVAELMGFGLIYSTMRTTALAGLVVLLVVLVRRWRSEICDTYLKGWPDGRLAAAVSQSREKWYGVAVALVALGSVSARAAVVIARDFVLGFEQTRQALAYLFRVRVERAAAKRSSIKAMSNLDNLPPSMLEACRDIPCEDPRLLVPRAVDKELAEAALGRKGRVLVVAGPYGVGRTTALKLLAKTASEDPELKVVWWTPDRRVLAEGALWRSLAEPLEFEGEGTPTCDQLRQHVLASEQRRLVIVDGLEWMFLRSLHGYRALDGLIDLAADTRETATWVLSAPDPSWNYLSSARLLNEQVGQTVRIDRWSEAELLDLLRRRQRVSGEEICFSELLVGTGQTGTEPGALVETEEGYVRLLWNAADGNPRVAQHYWLRSLEPGPDGLQVKLYESPRADDLESLPETDRFLLQTIVLHRALRPEEAARAAGIPLHRTEQHFARALDIGLYEPIEEDDDRHRVATIWWEAVVRFLKRKNLLTTRK